MHHNLCHDVQSYSYGGWGLYFDQATSNVSMHDNLIYNTRCAPFMHHWGQNNTFTNNILISNTSDCYASGALQSQPGDIDISFAFERNVVYIESGMLFGPSAPGGKAWSDPNQTLSFDQNTSVYLGKCPCCRMHNRGNLLTCLCMIDQYVHGVA